MIQNAPANNAASSGKTSMRRIGRFTVTDKLGSGSNGNVLLGHDPIIDRGACARDVLAEEAGVGLTEGCTDCAER